MHAHSTYTSWKDTEMIKLTKDMAAPLKHLNASLCSFYFSKITAMAIEEFNKRFEKKSTFEALLI